MRRRKRVSAWGFLLLASLAAHAGALLSVRASVRPGQSKAHTSELWIDSASADTHPTSTAAHRPTLAPSTQERAPGGRSATSGKLKSNEGDSSPAKGSGGSDAPIAGDAILTPSSGFVLGLGGPSEGEESPQGGHTIRNGQGDEPDPDASREYASEKLARRLNDAIAQDIGANALAVGSVPGHFVRVAQAMRKSLAKEKPKRSKVPLGASVRRIATAMIDPNISKSAADEVADSALGRSAMTGSVPLTNVDDQRFREAALSMMAVSVHRREQIQAVQLTTILEMTTTSRGVLAELTIVQESGDPVFDQSVLHLSQTVARRLPDDDENALGTGWWKSLWRFTYAFPDVKVKLLSAHQIKAP